MKNDEMLAYVRENKDRIRMMHVKDGECVPNAGGGVYGGFNDWSKRQSRFRSLGDGQIRYARVFKHLKQLGLDLWATVEWECAVKRWDQGVAEGARYVQAWLDGEPQPAKTEPIGPAEVFDDFAGGGAVDTAFLAKVLGIPEGHVNTARP